MMGEFTSKWQSWDAATGRCADDKADDKGSEVECIDERCMFQRARGWERYGVRYSVVVNREEEWVWN